MIRKDVQKTVEPIIRDCVWKFGENHIPDMPAEEFAKATAGLLRPDIRRISLIISLLNSVAGSELDGEGLELGCGFGFLLISLATFFPGVQWTAIDHPGRTYFNRPDYQQMIRNHNCCLVGLDFVHEPLPFTDRHFSVITFSETLEHLPVERIYFVLDEISRVLRPGGLLIASSPNQASLENRIRLFKGKSVFGLPDDIPGTKGVFGHIRLYTPAEMGLMMSQRGFSLERSVLESNNSVFRGKSPKSLHRRLYSLYERVEQRLQFLRPLGDTWYMIFRKYASAVDGLRTLK
jgi:SAM-dependent methyltransferase